ncbi:MAG TPA: hypothetical protein VNI78_09845 [Vicinamibacterales bacterium]|nr:hypothetical protein [Vicinamibacterales bacterium]
MKADIMAREANRTVTPAEVRDALERPITAEEREQFEALVSWFTRRYPTPAARLAYVRRAYARWRTTARRSQT